MPSISTAAIGRRIAGLAAPHPGVPALDPKAHSESPVTYENGTCVGTSVYRDGATRPTQRPDSIPLVPFL